jgi:Dolichyl-phosphate-mannose-protein mannosyltransferase
MMVNDSPVDQNHVDEALGGKRHARLNPTVLILLLGFLIRLYACLNTHIINPDGPLYIHQARAIYFGQWDQLTSCGLGYLSIYPPLIALVYAFSHNWVAAARAVLLFFGTMTLLPIYLLLRRFCERHVSQLSLLILALIPTFVDASAEVIREPVAWPFVGFGLYFFVKHLEERNPLQVVLSSCSFLIALTARIEFLLFFVLAFLYLLTVAHKNKVRDLLYFLAPAVVLVASALFISQALGISPSQSLRFDDVYAKLSGPLREYRGLRQSLTVLIHQPVMGTLELFLETSRKLVWFIGFAAVAVYVVEAFFYLFFIPFLLGLAGLGRKMKEDRRILFLMLLSFFALLLLYIHLLQTWVIATRFLALFMLPSFICVGFGVEKLIRFFGGRFHLGIRPALAVLCLLIIGFTLPKDLRPREKDKVDFKRIGEIIAKTEGNAHVIPVASSLHLLRWLSFYSNLSYQGAPCPQPYSEFEALVGSSYDHFVRSLKDRGIKYFVWEEKYWPKGTFNFEEEVHPDHFKVLGSWSHADTGRIVLYHVT